MRKHLLSVVVLRHKAGASFLGIMAQLKVTKTTQGDIVDDAPVESTKQPQRGPRKGVHGGFVNFQRCGVLRGGNRESIPLVAATAFAAESSPTTSHTSQSRGSRMVFAASRRKKLPHRVDRRLCMWYIYHIK